MPVRDVSVRMRPEVQVLLERWCRDTGMSKSRTCGLFVEFVLRLLRELKDSGSIHIYGNRTHKLISDTNAANLGELVNEWEELANANDKSE